ncbi:DUF6082 family protein [Plantactinospora endophytica]|uniref:DUF6082 family protein n=1 Tax=Plantactinospora endophytica TaxID=673535 RepID=UPI0036712EE0
MDNSDKNRYMQPKKFSTLSLRNQELRRAKLRRAVATAIRLTGATVAVVILLIAVATSPFVLLLIDRDGSDWAKLSNIGQTYGAVSALLSALAVAGVSLSLLMQRRQARLEHIRATRQAHEAIMRLPYENPGYGQCWGPGVAEIHQDERLYYYVSSILSYWYDAWSSGDLSTERLRGFAARMFQSEVPRQYWERFGSARQDRYGRRARFFRLLDEQYREAVAAGPALRPYEALEEARRQGHPGSGRYGRPESGPASFRMLGIGVALGVLAAASGAAIMSAIHQRPPSR